MSGADASAESVSPRQRIRLAQAHFDQQFRQGAEVSALIRGRAHFFDGIISELYHAEAWPPGPDGAPTVAIIAVGGYGRGELHPHSDIDLLILLDNEDPAATAVVERYLLRMWDLGMTIGHSVRTVEQCREEAAKDVTVMTNLLESRTIAGPERLRLSMNEAVATDKIWPAKDFFQAKVAEQEARHRRHDNTEYNLEPNVKSSPGGLRDIQMLGWVAKRHFGTSDFEHLIGLGFLSAGELIALLEGRQFLWKVRWGLHMLSGRGEDRLLLDQQRELAVLFGYEDAEGMLAVERFMHDYYRHVLALRELNDVVLQHFDEAIVRAGEETRIEPVNARFQIHNDYMEMTSPEVFRRTPSALLEVFVLMANHERVQGVRAATIRAIRDHLDLIDDDFRSNPDNARLFMDLLRSPYRLVSQLTRMRRYGVLGRYLPEFGRIIGQMQHDLFHIYTVDAHTMLLIRNLRRFGYASSEERYPVAHRCVRSIAKPELLYVAGLYHDIAKGRGGDHSELGAVDARAFCQRHGLAEDETELVAWLVEAHLLMSAVAQRKDINDPDVIAEFAREVRTQERLNYLYALTVADINATNPTLWNSWRATLMRQLYRETSRFLSAGVDREVDRQEWIGETRDAALSELVDKGVDREQVLKLWQHTDEDYFLKHDHQDIAWQMEAVTQHDLDRDGPLVRVRDQLGEAAAHAGAPHEGATQIFIYTRDHPNLFAATVAALDQLNLSVLDARIHTSSDDLCFNTLMVLDEQDRPVGSDPAKVARIQETLTRVLLQPEEFPTIVKRRLPRTLRHFRIPTSVEIVNEPNSPHTEIRVVAADRPGLLARLGLIFMEEGIVVHNAKIATLGERIDDVFFVTDGDYRPIEAADRTASLREAICSRLDEQVGLG
ncbi:MAG: [protein-PII] uridylyltransferase [Gammaproteobacteria bacterium]|nr:[protein-PII] uridylyltransferase [Gammaproteobacteria bacterium]